jgi:hypothetical protein
MKFEVVKSGDQYGYVTLECGVMGSNLYDEDLF